MNRMESRRRMQNNWTLFGRTAPPAAAALIRSAADIERGIRGARAGWLEAGIRAAREDFINKEKEQ